MQHAVYNPKTSGLKFYCATTNVIFRARAVNLKEFKHQSSRNSACLHGLCLM